jgi:hypothetical protein
MNRFYIDRARPPAPSRDRDHTRQTSTNSNQNTAQAKADRHWQPFIEKWKWELVADSRKQQLALSTLTSITDARAVPSIRRVFGHGKPAEQCPLGCQPGPQK